MLNLKNVTLLTIHDKDPNISLDLLNICLDKVSFDKVKLLSSFLPDKDLGDVEFVSIPNLGEFNCHDQSKGKNGYNEFCVYELHKYVDTEFVMTVQTDGFITNPQFWTDEFFNYDWIGAVWPDFILHGSNWVEPEVKKNIPNFVGNGGFSFRSKKILEVAAKCPKELIGPEDVYYCLNNYEYFMNNGINYAPIDLANKFSKDDWGKVHTDCFGFHGNRDYINTLI
tara:strand:+ start:1206 stop:1880 length:675 start_codon:yes stop_codon:yes gene_type:complete